MPALIFVVESDIEVCRRTRSVLEEVGYTVRAFLNPNLMDEVEKRRPALALIDASLSDGSGLDLCCRIRQSQTVARMPIIFMTAGNLEEDRVRALELGGDDCVSKSFSPRELVARVGAVLRRLSRPAEGSSLRHFDLVIDPTTREIRRGQDLVPLTRTEFDLLVTLASQPGRVWTRDQMGEGVFGESFESLDRTIDSHVKNMRIKLGLRPDGGSYVETVRGVGYRAPRAGDPA